MPNIKPYTDLHKEALAEVFNMNVPKFFGPQEITDLFEFIKEHKDTYFILLSENEEVIGGGGYHFPSMSIGRLSWFFLNPGYQGKGIGGLLIQHCINKIKETGITEMEVWTSQYGEHFFGKYGFTEVERKTDFWAEGLELVKMRTSAAP